MAVLLLRRSGNCLPKTRLAKQFSQYQTFDELEHHNWERGSSAYSSSFGPLTSQAIPTLLRQGNLQRNQPCDVLDVATGPGFVSLQTFSCISSHSCVTGLDFSSKMLELAEKNLQGNVPSTMSMSLINGNAEKMPFHDNSFDSILCNFGILHLGKPDQFLLEAFRCLRAGGTLSFSVWAAPPKTEAFDIILSSIEKHGNMDVELPSGPPFFRFADINESIRSLKEAGFEHNEVVSVDDMVWNNITNSDELWRAFIEGTARTRALLEGQTFDQSLAIMKEIDRKFNKSSRCLKMPAVISSGTKPLK